MAYVPQDAIDIFERPTQNTPQDVVKAGILNSFGKPVSPRTAREWHLNWRAGIAASDNPKESTKEKFTADDFEDKEPTVKDFPGKKVISSQSTTISSIDQLIEYCKIDLKEWRIERSKVKSYGGFRADKKKDLEYVRGKATGSILDMGEVTTVTMFSIEVTLVPNFERSFENALDKLVEKKLSSPRVQPIVRKYPVGDYLLMPCAYDIHFSRRDLTNTYTPDRTARELKQVFGLFASRTAAMAMPISRILFPIAGDTLNVDNMHGTTTKGTPQETSSDPRDAAEAASTSLIECIEMMLELGPVDVVGVKGNHDEYGMFWLMLVIKAWFSNHKYSKYVNVDTHRAPRKYYQFGSNLIGIEHGDKVKEDKLAGLMALEAPDLWGDTTHRTFIRGHFHRERETYIRIGESVGVTVVTVPTFAPPDEWELQMGYIGNKRRAEGRLFHHEHGPAGMFPIFVDELE